MARILVKVLQFLKYAFRFQERIETAAIGQAICTQIAREARGGSSLSDYEFKVFSQWGEDGIIQKLVHSIHVENKTFIEFGVEDFSESNCRYLMMKDNWSGMVIDGSDRNIEKIKSSYYYWRYDLTALSRSITAENINQVLAESSFDHDLGLLSIDIDGVDYHVLKAISDYKPRILVCEYNAVFGASRKITVPYSPTFLRNRAHYSNLYFGASLGAFVALAESRGYIFVGAGSAGVNAFFVRKDVASQEILRLSQSAAFIDSKMRESRDQKGNLTFVCGEERLSIIKGLPVVNVEKESAETL